MRLLLPIILLAGLLHAQGYWVRWAGELTTPDQREFAQKCYEFGKQYNRGHTLTAIAWMESSFGQNTQHNSDRESSFGPFGISKLHVRGYNKQSLLRAQNADISLAPSDLFEINAGWAIQIFEDNIRYFRRLGYSPGAAWWWAAARYNGGNTPNEEYARKFNRRAAYLKTQFK